MSTNEASHPKPTHRQIWLGAAWLWLVLLAMFALNVALAFVHFSGLNVVVHMSIAGVMIILLVLFFMDFKSYTALLRFAALAGLFWLVFMFVLTGADYFTRQ